MRPQAPLPVEFLDSSMARAVRRACLAFATLGASFVLDSAFSGAWATEYGSGVTSPPDSFQQVRAESMRRQMARRSAHSLVRCQVVTIATSILAFYGAIFAPILILFSILYRDLKDLKTSVEDRGGPSPQPVLQERAAAGFGVSNALLALLCVGVAVLLWRDFQPTI